MSAILLITTIVVLLFIAFQDFKSFEIYWFLFPVAFVLLFLKNVLTYTFESILYLSLINLIIITIQVLVLFLYIRIRYKEIDLFKKYFALGDLLMMSVLITVFDPTKLLMFEIISLITTLMLGLIVYTKKKRWNFKIPLAGIWSVFLSVLLIMEKMKYLSPLVEPIN